MIPQKVWIEGSEPNITAAVQRLDAEVVANSADANLLIYQPAQNGFWHVDNASGADSQIYAAEFEPEKIPFPKAERAFNALRERLVTPFPHPYPLDEFVLVALTDKLEAPDKNTPNSVEIIEQTLEMEPERLVLVRIPDDVIYSGTLKDELFEFDFHERVIFTRGNLDRLLDACAFVVTQDSPVAVRGLLHRKPAIQFSRTDCHHIFRKSYEEKRLKKCFNRMMRDRPEYEKYVFWLYSELLLDPLDKNFEKRLAERFQRLN